MPSETDHQNSDRQNSIEESVYSETSNVVLNPGMVRSADNTIISKKMTYDLPENQEI